MNTRRTRVAIALGSNLDDRFELLRSGVDMVTALDDVTLLATTLIEETESLDGEQPLYLNQMMLIDTGQSMPALLTRLQEIEDLHGRSRSASKGPRTLDLDIVWASETTVTTLELLIPHPGLIDRDFWQRELAELLGVVDAAEAIAAAQVHAGRDTAEMGDARHERRWSGGWEIVQ
jgi:2-amino-4-hydroxy-6-hydroxymethyldihydropteridine diphosphokinase